IDNADLMKLGIPSPPWIFSRLPRFSGLLGKYLGSSGWRRLTNWQCWGRVSQAPAKPAGAGNF
ncbi:MAG: hypothetical protein ACYC7M_10445, partial [Bellilinea sp.]